ncbi:MAG: hypothetical protein KJZ80_06265 [Hyphomicrobiaceae bacterium]|nr:hypothetical protein [Hyphomicrobiaceae bacterium]
MSPGEDAQQDMARKQSAPQIDRSIGLLLSAERQSIGVLTPAASMRLLASGHSIRDAARR